MTRSSRFPGLPDHKPNNLTPQTQPQPNLPPLDQLRQPSLTTSPQLSHSPLALSESLLSNRRRDWFWDPSGPSLWPSRPGPEPTTAVNNTNLITTTSTLSTANNQTLTTPAGPLLARARLERGGPSPPPSAARAKVQPITLHPQTRINPMHTTMARRPTSTLLRPLLRSLRALH